MKKIFNKFWQFLEEYGQHRARQLSRRKFGYY